VDAEEAERIGLITRLVPVGHARRAAVELATSMASFPWPTLLADRDSVYDGLGRPLSEGLALEAKRGVTVLGVGAEGAERFARGAGRHGRT
jgi:enoyl-CoA hydratase